MQIFKFKDVGGGAVTLVEGEIINGIHDSLWVERYRDPGEFKIAGPLSSGLREALPIGSLISHTDTSEVMMVENHEINDEEDEDTKISITGRSFDAYLEERVVGWSLYWDNKDLTLTQQPVYTLASGTSYAQAAQLIKDHINTARTPAAANNQLVNVNEATRITLPSGNYPTYSATQLRRGYVHPALVEILGVNDLGIRIVRPGIALTSLTAAPVVTRFVVHDGIDRRATVMFSYDLGDLKSADYLWSLKRNKTEAIISGRYLDQAVTSSKTGLQRREIFVDGGDIDGVYTSYPTGANKTNALASMAIRGNAEVLANNDVEVTRVDISRTNQNRYRVDYDIGDLVRLDGNYGSIQVVRVVEYVEVQDQDTQYGYPTVSIVNVA
jgi:hypothetical protein